MLRTVNAFHLFTWYVNGFHILLRRNISKVDDGAKISHSRLEESGAFSISEAFSFSHLAYLRNTIAAASTHRQCLKPFDQTLEEVLWCKHNGYQLSWVWLDGYWGSQSQNWLLRDCSLVFQAKNSCKIGSFVDLRTEGILHCLMSTLFL